ncbi:unnamed protein product [Bubo scandiacus]
MLFGTRRSQPAFQVNSTVSSRQQEYMLVKVIVFSDISRYDLDSLGKNVSFLWGIVLTIAVITLLSVLEQEFLKKLMGLVVGALG